MGARENERGGRRQADDDEAGERCGVDCDASAIRICTVSEARGELLSSRSSENVAAMQHAQSWTCTVVSWLQQRVWTNATLCVALLLAACCSVSNEDGSSNVPQLISTVMLLLLAVATALCVRSSASARGASFHCSSRVERIEPGDTGNEEEEGGRRVSRLQQPGSRIQGARADDATRCSAVYRLQRRLGPIGGDGEKGCGEKRRTEISR